MNGTNGKAPLGDGTSTPRSNEPIVKVQPPRREDLQPSYAQIIKPDTQDDSQHGWYGSMINTLGSCVGTMGAIPCCIVCPNPYKPVAQGNVGLVTRFGRFARAVDPGLVKINPLSENLIQVDVKIQIVEVPKQVCMTKDNVNLHLTSVIYYHIISPHKAAFGISNIRQALIERTQTTLRHVIGARVLQDVIERREEIAQSIREIIEETAAGWGVAVESMLIKDIIFSQELQDSLSMAAQSKRTGEAKVITARAEVESAKLMRQAADILSSAPAMQIRYLEAMQSMAKTANSKVIFLPAQNQTVQSQLAQADKVGEGPSSYQNYADHSDFGNGTEGFQSAINSRVVENIYERRWKADSIIAAPDLTELPTRAAILDKGVTVFGGTEPRKTSNSEDDKVESTLRTIATDIAIQTSEEEVARVFLGEDIVDLPTGEVSTTSKAEEWINGYPRLDLV